MSGSRMSAEGTRCSTQHNGGGRSAPPTMQDQGETLMKHISEIIKRVMQSIKVEDKTDPDAEKRERQGQWDEAMGELHTQETRFDDEYDWHFRGSPD